ncbi:MAG TPA: ABC transporter substrate-binding protein [Candidatus Binatia bacterium]|nr:ABC transporter substrate-binding protein [Candidatus Binatia bacterium]
MKRAESIAVLAAVSLLGPRRAFAQEQPVLHAAGPPNDGFKAMYYGARSGIFAKYGLTVEITPTNNGSAAAAALISGDMDVAMVNILTLIQAHRKGIAMRMIAPNFWITSDKPNISALVLKDSPLRGGRDLAGKTIASPGLGDILSVGTQAWIDQNGGDSRTVHFIELPSSAAVQFLEQGRADVVTVIEPFVGQAMATGKVRILAQPMYAIAKQLQVGSYVVMEPVVLKKFDAMSRLARGLHEASLYTNTHLAETVELVASYSGASPEAIAKMNRVVDPEYCEVRYIQPVIDALAKYGAIDKGFPAGEIISSAALKPPR